MSIAWYWPDWNPGTGHEERKNRMTMTYGEALALSGISIPEHLEAEAEVPVLTGPQAQGDLLIIPMADAYRGTEQVPFWPQGTIVPMDGVQVVHGEATGNTHWLHAGFNSPGVTFYRPERAGAVRAEGVSLVVGVVTVPAGQSAMLVHTDEHGANGIGEGRYEIRQKREQADEVRYVED